MHSVQQREMLKALGVTYYFPRELGNFAAASTATASKASAPAITASNKTLASVVESFAAQPASAEAGIVDTPQPNIAAVQKPAVEQQISSAAPSRSAAVEFIGRLFVWQPRPDWMIVQVGSRNGVPTRDERQLLSNICQATFGSQFSIAEPELIDWPQGASSDRSLAGFRAMLLALLPHRPNTQHLKGLWLMGSACFPLFFADQHPEVGDELESGNYRFLCLPALGDMLQDANQKRLAWQRLKSLVVQG